MKKGNIENRRIRWLKKNKLAIMRICLLLTVFVLGVLVGVLINLETNFEEAAKSEGEMIVERQVERQEYSQPNIMEMEMLVTAYCPCEKCCGKEDGITATGTQATAGRTIAVDPELIPYGTKVQIGGNIYVAEDCGSSIKGRRIDVYFDSHDEAKAYGVKETTCTWVKEE